MFEDCITYLKTSSGDNKELAISVLKIPLLMSKYCGIHNNLITRSSTIAK